jgi:hypothetical protein
MHHLDYSRNGESRSPTRFSVLEQHQAPILTGGMRVSRQEMLEQMCKPAV